jgi:UDP-glucose 4-epimerase
MTILVTGGAGYIGSHMVHELVDANERVVVLDNLATGFDWAVPAEVPLIVGDTGDQDLVARIISEHQVSAVIHFAASVVVPDSVADPLGYYRNNTVNARALIESAVRGGVAHFIFSSTAAVYGNPARFPVGEDEPTNPLSPYGSSKLMAEIMLRDAGTAHGLSHVILRYFNVAGADPQLRTGQSTRGATHLIKVAAETAVGLRPRMDVFGTDYPTPDGTCIRDYIHVLDLAEAHIVALESLLAGGSSDHFNVGTGVGHSIREVIAVVEKVTGKKVPYVVGPRREGDPPALVADCGKLQRTLGWKPRTTGLRGIVADAWEFEKNRTGVK